MIFTPIAVPGAYLIEIERWEDSRGFFARTWCQREFAAHGLCETFAQCNTSYSKTTETLRGMHFQRQPYEEIKLVRCIRGAVYDVIIDLRPTSPTFRRWVGTNLTAERRNMLYVPAGCAHGFFTLEDESEVFYQVSQLHEPAHESGVRYDDPAFGIRWPGAVQVISDKDRSWPDFSEQPALR